MATTFLLKLTPILVGVMLMLCYGPLAQAAPRPVAVKSGSRRSSKAIHSLSHAARQRMANKAQLMKSWHQHLSLAAYRGHTVPTPPVIPNHVRWQRQQNLQFVRRADSPFQIDRPGLQHLADSRSGSSLNYLDHVTEAIMGRLKDQLGKPYVWGGTSPRHGFDCSGLVFFAFNPLLARHLPRTANQMYHFQSARRVALNDIQRGDLLFFHIHSHGENADHVGVYLGEGNFIESPRSGENIRISHLAEPFWQNHLLGARRVLLANNVR